METSHHSLKVIWLLLTGIAMLAVAGCKPDSPHQTGALVSPAQTPIATALVSPIQTPQPTPWPDNLTHSIGPMPSPTPAILVGPQTLHDTVNHFSVTLLPGWYGTPLDPKAIGGVTEIAN